MQNNIFGKSAPQSSDRLRYATDEYDATGALLESLIVMEDEYFNITKEHMVATHIAMKDGNYEILEEGIRDFFNSAVDFFKRMLEKFKEFMMKIFMYINAFIGNFEKFLERYKDKLATLDPDFTIKGYKYTFKESIPNLDKIQMLVSNYNSELTEAGKMKKEDIIQEREEYTSEEAMGKLRGHVLDTGHEIHSDDLIKEAKKVYRDDSEEEVDVKVDKSVLSSTIADYSNLKKTRNDCSKQRDKVILLIENLKDFFARSAQVHYKGRDNKVIYAHNIKVSERGTSVEKDGKNEIDYSTGTLETLNVFYNFKWIQAKEIGAICVASMTEKLAALKEAMKQSEKIIRKSLFNEKKLDSAERSVTDATTDL